MPLTPLDIKKKDFSRSLRGFDPGEVSAFLETIADEFDRTAAAVRGAEQRVTDLERQLSQYASLERNIQQALVQAQESAAKTLDAVQREASVKLREAELEASRILEQARRESEKIVGQAQQDVNSFTEEIASLRAMRGTLLARIKTFLTQQAQALRELERDDLTPLQPEPHAMFNVSIDEILKRLE